MDEYYQVVQSLPSWLARPLLDMPSALAPDVQELRLRVGCAPAFTMRGAVCTPQETARELASLQRIPIPSAKKPERNRWRGVSGWPAAVWCLRRRGRCWKRFYSESGV